jgi:hypothetical protein
MCTLKKEKKGTFFDINLFDSLQPAIEIYGIDFQISNP